MTKKMMIEFILNNGWVKATRGYLNHSNKEHVEKLYNYTKQMIEEYDILFNKWLDDEITPVENKKLATLITILNLQKSTQ